MASWGTIESAEPEFAARVRQSFEGGRHKTLATLRRDGSPRISGIECTFDAGELRFGSMPGSRKSADLVRDPRFAMHGPSYHPEPGRDADWPGEAKIAGLAVRTAPRGDEQVAADAFVADIRLVVFTHLNADATLLVTEWWTPDTGLRRSERA